MCFCFLWLDGVTTSTLSIQRFKSKDGIGPQMVLNSKDERKQLLQANHLEIYLKLRKKKPYNHTFCMGCWMMNIWKYTLKYCHLRTSCDPSCTLHQPTRWPPLFLRVRAHHHTCVYYGICRYIRIRGELYRPVWYVSVYAYIFYTHGICKVFNLFGCPADDFNNNFQRKRIWLAKSFRVSMNIRFRF